MKPVTLTTDRLLLRPFEPADTAAVHAACQDPDIPRWTSVPSPYTRAEAERFVGTLAPKGWRDDTAYAFAVVTRANGTLVGSMSLLRIARLRAPERQAELGYWTTREQRGNGYTAEAARALARWAFRDLGVERLEWRAEAGNYGSWAVARSVGFQREGTLRAQLVRDGIRRDRWIGSLLPSDLPPEPARTQAPTPYHPYPH